MPPSLDPEIRAMVTWLPIESGENHQDLPIGPMRLLNGENGKRTAVAVGKDHGEGRKIKVLTLDR